MSRNISRQFHAALANEIQVWQEENLISKTQAEQLLTRYPKPVKGSNAIAILTILGAIFVGLGTILLIGSNWQAIPVLGKLLAIAFAIVLTDLAGWRLKYEPGARPKLGSALLLLGSLFFGGGIWLIGQIFHLDSQLKAGLFLWALGTVPMALITGSSALGILAVGLIAAWNLTAQNGILIAALTFSASLIIAYRLRSPWTMAFALVGGALWCLLWSHAYWFALLSFGAGIFAWYIGHRRTWHLFTMPYLLVGLASSLAALLGLTFRDYSTSTLDGIGLTNLGLVTGVAWLSCLFVLGREKDKHPELLAALALCASGCFLACLGCATDELWLWRIGSANLLLFATLIGLVYSGVSRLESPALVNTAVAFFVLDIVCRYFDAFFHMFDRSLFFFVGGLVLLGVGALIEQGRRQLLSSLPARAVPTS